MAELHRLPNGLSVLVDRMAGAQSASVGLYAAVGSRSEPEDRGGLAHMLEHMVFKGAGSRDARGIAEAIENVGGQLNAWTARDQTVFHARTLPADVPLAVELIADLIRDPRLDEAELEREKGVILSELGECRDNPEDRLGDLLFEAAYPEQPLGRPIIGHEGSIAVTTQADLQRWIGDQLIPARLLLVATGAVDADAILQLAERRFGDMAARVAPASPAAAFGGGKRIDARAFEQAHWSFALEGLPGSDPMMPALSVFAQAVGGGMSSRLFQQLREERGLCYSVYAWTQGFADTGIFAINAATDRPTARQSLELAREIVADAAATLSDEEAARARAQIIAQMLMSLESVQGRADHHARMFELFGRVVPVEETLPEIAAVDARAARTAGQRLLAGPVALASIGGGRLALAA